MGMDRAGIEPSPTRMLSGCDTTTPTAPEMSRPRVLKHLLRIAFSAEGPEGAAGKRLRRQQRGKGKKPKECAGFGTRPRWKQPPLARRTANPRKEEQGSADCPRRRRAWDRPGIEPALSGVMPLHQLPLS